MAQKQQAFGQKKSQFEKKLVGICDVVTGEEKAQFTLKEDGKLFANGTNRLRVRLDELPKRPSLKPNMKGKQYRIRMNSEGDEVEALTPVSGLHRGHLIDIGPRPEKDADPTPREKVFDEGGPKENRHFEFFAVYEITQGEFKGVQTPAYNLHYKFEEDENNPGYAGFTFSLENRKATRGIQLAEWGNIHKVWDVQGSDVYGEPIEWDDVTILPEILDRALDADVEVDLLFKDGYIKELIPVDSEDDDAEESDPDGDELDESDGETDDDFDKKFPPIKAKVSGKNVPTKEPVKAPAKTHKKAAPAPAKSHGKVKPGAKKSRHVDDEDDL